MADKQTTNWEDFTPAPGDKPLGAMPAGAKKADNWGEGDKPFDSGLPRSLGDYAKDAAAWAVKGAIGVPEAIVGLADIPTGGAVGKALENEGGSFGMRFKEAKEIANDWHSDATKQAQQKYREAEGIGGKFKAAKDNPSNIVGAVVESLPAMGAGGVAARGLLGATRLGQMGAKGAALAGAAGEGIMGAGSAAEQIRQETPDGLLTPMQSAAGIATGLANAAFGALGGKVANRLGIGDAETMLAQGAKGAAAAAPQAAAKSIPRSVIEGAISEGLLEELPQSVSEQVIQNLALGKEWSEGVDGAAVMGVLSGGAMGGAAAGYHSAMQPKADPAAAPGDPAVTPPATQPLQAGPTLALPAPDQGVIAVGADGTARTPAYQAPGYVGDVTDVQPKVIDPVREQVAAAAEQGGALSAAALTAIDTGTTAAMQPPVVEQAEPAPISLEEADARDQAAYEQFFASVDSEPVVARYFENDDDIPDFDAASNVSEADFLRSLGATDEDIQDAIATSRQSVSPQGSAAVDAGTQADEPAGPSQGAGADAAGQASQVVAAPTSLREGLAQIRTQKQQEAANAQATQEPAPAAAEAPGAAAAPAVEAAGVANDFPTTQGSTNGPQADQAQQAATQPAQAGAAPAAEPATSVTQQATAGTPEVRALTDGAQAENTGAQAAPAAGAQGEAAASAETVPQRLKRERAEKNAAKADALPREKSKPKSVAARAKEAQAARADYFTPGNIVKGYGGYDRVVAYSPPDENGRWSVTVRAVRKDGDVWVDEPGVRGRVRVHETQPDAKELKAGPIQRAAVSSTAEASDAPANAPASTQSTTMQVDPADSGKETQPAQAETGPFGPILTQYRGDAQGAIKALTELQDGEAVAALNHPDVGDIDLVWGEEGTGNKDGFGLAKLQKFHPEVLDDLQGFLSTLAKDPKRSGKNRVRLVSEGGEAAVSLDWKGDRKVWLLTAYEKGAGDGTTMNTADVVNRDDTTRPDASASTSLPPTATAPQPIQDAGQKIGGARKDRWKERGLNLEDLDAMTESEGAELATKANVWKPDYEAMSEASEPVTAAMVKIIYDQLAAKPKKNTPEGRRQYVQMMRIVRDVLTEANSPEAVRNAYQAIRQRAGLNTIEPQAKTAARELMFSVYKGRSDPFVLGGADLMKAKKMVQDGFPAKGAPWKTRLVVGREEGGPGTTERGVEIYMARSAEVGTPLTREQILDGFYRVVTKDNKAVAFAASKADAEAAAATVYERDMKGKKDGKPEPVRPNLDELKRENMPRRIDRDVKADDFVNDLGFRGIEFGNWSAQDERQRILNMAYDGLMDLAEIMGVPPKAMSLNGTLGMAFGARGGGRFAAHYEPGKLVINMTKIRGGGSMAHEWAHAMDHYFGELDKPDAYTTQARGASGWYSEDQYLGVPRKRMEKVGNEWKNVEKMRLDNLRPEMAAAFDGVMRALFSKQITKAEMVRSHELDLERTEALARNEQQPDLKAMYQNMVQNKQQALNEMRGDPEGTMYAGRGRSEYASQAQKLSGKSTDGYWVRPTEMFARAFESWVFDRVTAMGSKSDYLVHGVEEDRFAGGAYKGNPYPTGEERARINAAFDKLASTIKTRETDKGVAMFSRSQGTKSAYESRIDALFAGDTASRMGAKVLDRSDVLGLLGYPDQPVVLAEGKVRQGQDNHQRMTAEVWKKIPEWLDNPAAAFDSDTVPGRLVLIAPELVNGAPVRMILEPNTAVGGMQVHLLVNAFDAAGRTPWMRWAADGLTRYVDKKKFPEILAPSGLQLSRVEQASRGTAKILTDKQLSGYRRANSPSFDREAQAGLSPEQAVAALYAEGTAPTADSNARLVATQMLVDGLVQNWTRAPEIIVARNMQDRAIPQAVRDYDQTLKSQGATGEPRGFIYKGKVYLLSDELRGPQQIAEVLFHEALGHFGLRGAFGDSLKPILQQMGTMRRRDVVEKAREYGMVSKGMNDADTWAAMSVQDRLSAAEEVLAEMAQSTPEIGFVQRAVAAIRTWLRANVPGFKQLALTDAEIVRSYILPARGFVTRSSETPQQSLERAMMAFSRGPAGGQTETAEFKRWFGDSKVVDGEGKPLVVYHGTGADFSEFSASKIGSAWGADTVGFFFTDSAKTASSYATSGGPTLQRDDGANIIPAYIRISRPVTVEALEAFTGESGLADAYESPIELMDERRDDIMSMLLGNEQDDWSIDKDSKPSVNNTHDGVIFSFGGSTLVVAVDPRQIKSAIGNNGGFDPDDARINFSRTKLDEMKAGAMDRINQALTFPGKVSMWDKTVGTMRHLGERAPAFKPVFEAAQRFIDDVSTLANEAADEAPRLLPRVETLADLKKKPITAEDNKAIAKPIFEGTLIWGRDADGKAVLVDDLAKKYANLPAAQKAQMLLATDQIQPGTLKMWQGLPLDQYETLVNSRFESKMLKAGVVWTDAELQSLFKATPEQISLYREARAAIDRSIDLTARADMLRAMGPNYSAMRDAVMEAPTLRDAMGLATEVLQQDARANPDDSDRLMAINNQVVSRFEGATALQESGYAPLSRFGRYTVDVVDTAGERQYFGMFEDMAEANKMAAKMRGAFPGAAVTSGTMSQEAYKLFAGITPESLELFGNMLGLQSDGADARDKAFQEYLALAKNNHSALKRLIHRQGIAGYSEDVGRVLASFVYSNARQAAGGLNAGTMETAINNIPKEQGELKDVAMGLQSYISDPQEEGQVIRSMLFAQYLGGSLASAFVNMTQPFAVTMPYLSQFGGMKKAAAQLSRAVREVGAKTFKGEPDLESALRSAIEDGTVAPQEIHQLMAQARGTGSLRVGDGTKVGNARAAAANNWERVKVAWGQPFALAEQFNRRTTFIAAFRLAKAQGNANPADFARKAVLETQFLYSKANKARWARGAVGGTLMTFKTYSVSYLELLQRTWNAGAPGSPERAAGRRAVAWALVMLVLMSGAGGLPFVEDLEDLIDGAGQLMGYNVSAKQWRKQLLSDVLGKELGDFVNTGVSGLPGAPIDVSGRLGMGNLIPGTGLFLTKQNRERDLLEVAGPAGDLVARGFTGARKALTGDLTGAALELSPSAVRNAAKGIDMAASGIYKDTKGYKVLDTTLPEAAAKFIGFQPRSVAQVQEANSFMLRSKAFYTQTSGEIKAQWARALFEKDEAALQQVRERLDAWNRDNPEQRITVQMPDVWKRVREMGKDRTQRIADTAPKALREQMRQEVARTSGQG